MTPSTLLGIVFHSGIEELRACLASVPPSIDLDVVVLDSSPDGHARDLVRSFEATWLDGSRNGGYAWALHRIVDERIGEHQVFVASNADVRFLPGSLDQLSLNASALDAVCYPLQVDHNGKGAFYNVASQLTVQSLFAQWFGIGRRGMRRENLRFTRLVEASRSPHRIPGGKYGSGAVIAMPTHVWRSTGGLDRRFFLFSEDKSFGSTLQASGVQAYLCGDAPVVHLGGTLSQGVRATTIVESLVSEQLNWSKLRRGPDTVVVGAQAVAMAIRYVVARVRGRATDADAYATALNFRIRHRRMNDAASVGPDGFRVAALTTHDSALGAG